jgi:hypothetical protein
MITSLIAREMDVDFGYGFSAPTVFRMMADATPAYEGLRYPDLKDESNPAQTKLTLAENPDISDAVNALKERVDSMPDDAEKNTEMPKIGHKLHRITTMTGKTAQFHLLAHGNPKPDNLLVSPLAQFNADGTARNGDGAEVAAVSAVDRANMGGR